MKWVVQYDLNGKYICSSGVFVDVKQFAKRFKSRKQVGIFLANNGFDKKKCRLLQWEAVTYEEDWIAERINEGIKKIKRWN
ncbi:MAG: hypothetical protein LUG26_06005 [Ruminococcus sp.]|nr:hypothetical protein [Ruminococcus sp.]